MAAPNAFSMNQLGVFDGVRYMVARTSTPWRLPVDAIVVSVGSSLGNLGEALRTEFGGTIWNRIDFTGIAPDRPQVIELPGSAGLAMRLTQAILVSPHNQTAGYQVTDNSLRTATQSALAAAAMAGASAIALPLLATGALGESESRVARVVVPAALDTMKQFARQGLTELVFIGRLSTTVDAIEAAFATTAADSRLSVPGELAGGMSGDLVDSNIGIPMSADQLGVAPYVSMLATVIADRATPLPLSVGVFGEWGSGKSYFMAMLRERIRVLAMSGNDRYCQEFVQIGFNAWHYADTNLWASLGDEIFRQLEGSAAQSGTRAARIRAEMAARREQQQELESAAQQARATAIRLQDEVDQAVARREVSALNLLAAMRKSEYLRAKMRRLWRQLGIADEQQQAAVLAEQLNGTASEMRVLARALMSRIGWMSLALLAALVGIGALAPLLAAGIRGYPAWGIGVSTIATCLAPLTILMSRLHAGLRQLREFRQDMQDQLRQSAEDAVATEMASTLTKLREARAEEQVAQAQLDDVVTHLGELGGQLAELAPGRRLYTFLAERIKSGEYSGGLSVVSTIRKDLAQLVQLMAEWRSAPNPDDGRRPIDRIVLYIDDLDRCSSNQVVDVLQAVHLLLAFDLFVVVVGVDPRWLLRSLETRYPGLLHDGDHDDTIARWHMPEDYLHKILNIPMALPRMSPSTLGRLLHSLADEPKRLQGGQERLEGDPAAALGGSVTSVTATAAHTTIVDSDAAIGIERGSEVDAQSRFAIGNDSPLSLTEPELKLLGALDLFVDRPRDVKRLLNLYRMVRATRALSPASRFIGADGRAGEFEAVAILLATMSGYSSIHGQLFDTPPDPHNALLGGLAQRQPDSLWADFIADIEPHYSGSSWRNGILAPIAETQVVQWSRLHQGLIKASEVASLHDLTELQLWLPRVRCFTYTLTSTLRSGLPLNPSTKPQLEGNSPRIGSI
ncbi:hypothetical protein C5E44_03740 [Nocardia nova]|uniref:P-loop NTPase fold protein n=1 Tax=Nocardia nova TaxID=37330 RepID=UPI000CEA1C77|nr:hypothetical protein C5E44_03740 [Nocardia nova]